MRLRFEQHIKRLTGNPIHLAYIPASIFAKVARGHRKLDLIAQRNRTARHQIHICRKVVCDLRRQSAKVDRIGRTQFAPQLRHARGQLRIREYALYAALRIVKVAAHRYTSTLSPRCVTICNRCASDTPPYG